MSTAKSALETKQQWLEVEINCSGGSQAIGSITGNLVSLYLGMHPWAAVR
jgi:hypothetical protein